MDHSLQRRAVWSRYWQSGALHSCAASFDGELGPAASAYWQQAFTALPAGARLADLACGNGSLARALTRIRQPLDVECHCIDLAELQPAWATGLAEPVRARLHFHGGTALERLPLPDASLDLVCSQYGLEYARRDDACTEILRVLRPGGRLALLMHHADSLPVRLAATELRHADSLLSSQGLFAATAPMLDCVARAATPAGRAALERDPAALRARDDFNGAQDGIDAELSRSDCPDLLHAMRDAVHQTLGLAAQGRLADAQAQLSGLRQAVEDNRLRLQELRACALSEADLRGWLLALGVAGRAQVGELRERGELMGWTVRS